MFTEKPYSKPLEGNIVYIPITTSGQETSKKTMAVCSLIGCGRHHVLIDAVPKLPEKLRVNGLLLQFKRLYKIFHQGFG